MDYMYFAIISPPKNLISKIFPLKQFIELLVGSDHALHSVPHISLLKIVYDKNKEKDLLNCVKKFCDSQPIFEIELLNFDYFSFSPSTPDSSHTIYIDIPNKKKISNLARLLFTELGKHSFVPHGPFHLDRPHLTLARNLNPEQFYKVQSEFKNKIFKETFDADNITILKRPKNKDTRENYKWEDVKHRFDFGAKKITQLGLEF